MEYTVQASRYSEGVSMLDMLRLLRIVDQHQVTASEAAERLEWSTAKVKRTVALARLIGVDIRTLRLKGANARYYAIVDGGPMNMTRCRTLYGKAWL